jgi:hypothetical protein
MVLSLRSFRGTITQWRVRRERFTWSASFSRRAALHYKRCHATKQSLLQQTRSIPYIYKYNTCGTASQAASGVWSLYVLHSSRFPAICGPPRACTVRKYCAYHAQLRQRPAGREWITDGTGTGGTQSHKSRLLVRSRGQACQPRVTPPTHTPCSPPFWRCSAPVVCLGSRATWKAKSCSPPIGAVPSLPACQPASLPACPPACLPPRPPRCNGSQSRC